MRRRTSYWIRCVAAISALCGIVLYSALIPSHIVSQANSALAAGAGKTGRVASIASVLCHEDANKTAPAPGAPATPEKKCPFCAGYASFVVASVAPASIAIPTVEGASLAQVSFDVLVVRRALRAPQNRGPPQLPT
jgi:Protein of unknown function (DUF2946)